MNDEQEQIQLGDDAAERLDKQMRGGDDDAPQPSPNDEKGPQAPPPEPIPGGPPEPPAFVPPEPKPTSEPTDELDKIEMPKFRDPTKVEHWNKLKTTAREQLSNFRKQAEQEKKLLAERLQTFEKEKADWEKKFKELEPFKAAVAAEADPEFQAKYNKPVEAKITQIADILKRFNVDEKGVQAINWSDELGIEEIALAIEEKNKAAAGVFRRYAAELSTLRSNRDEALAQSRTRHQELVSQELQSRAAKATEYDARGLKKIDELVNARDEKGSPKFWWLNKMDASKAPAGTDPGQIERHNKFVESKQEQIRLMSKPQEPETQAEMAATMVLAEIQTYQLENAYKRINQLEEELKKRSNATDFSKGGRPPAQAATTRKTDGSQSAEAALHAAFPQHFHEPLND